MSKSRKVPTMALSGFMELLPADQILFNQFRATIQAVYERFGFVPIDTPVIERAEVLLAKAGGETEKQIYQFTKGDTDLALRFDLTVPLARYISEHFNDLTFPFRRYAIGKVYRGERPQQGRFREFYQCDIDIIGHQKLSLINDAELPSIIYTTFTELGFQNFTIRINNRKVLNGLLSGLGLKKKAKKILNIIDKLDKIGQKGIEKELAALEVPSQAIDQLMQFISIGGESDQIITELERLEIKDKTFETGVSELATVAQHIQYFNVPKQNFMIDLSIARGLDYYTGTVYETILDDYPDVGSVCSGGRYDNLATYYTTQRLPGVGLSIGLTRLFDQLMREEAIKSERPTVTEVLIIPMLDDHKIPLELAAQLRANNICTEVFLEDKKVKKMFRYADKLDIPHVVIIGENEVKEGVYSLKNMENGEQVMLSLEALLAQLKSA